MLDLIGAIQDTRKKYTSYVTTMRESSTESTLSTQVLRSYGLPKNWFVRPSETLAQSLAGTRRHVFFHNRHQLVCHL